MNQQKFQKYYSVQLEKFESYLKNSFPKIPKHVSILEESAKYSLLGGGKRIRPILLLTVIESSGQNSDFGLPFAAAIEYIHTYSLIHDDLPSIDDDKLRRGKPTNHVQFGEAIALLAGDALLTHSFYLISSVCSSEITGDAIQRIVKILSGNAGIFGMVSGQVADITQHHGSNPKETLQFIHSHKTGALITASIQIGAVLAHLDENTFKKLTCFGEEIGKCFQIQDDILDITGTKEKLGKNPGTDEKNQTLTYPSLYGLEASKKLANDSYQSAISNLDHLEINTDMFRCLADFILNRQH